MISADYESDNYDWENMDYTFSDFEKDNDYEDDEVTSLSYSLTQRVNLENIKMKVLKDTEALLEEEEKKARLEEEEKEREEFQKVVKPHLTWVKSGVVYDTDTDDSSDDEKPDPEFPTLGAIKSVKAVSSTRVKFGKIKKTPQKAKKQEIKASASVSSTSDLKQVKKQLVKDVVDTMKKDNIKTTEAVLKIEFIRNNVSKEEREKEELLLTKKQEEAEGWKETKKERKTPKKVEQVVKKVQPASLQKTQLCRSVKMKTTCPHGTSCRYAHSINELVVRDCAFGEKCNLIIMKDAKYLNVSREKVCNFKHPKETKLNYFGRVKI